MLLINLEKPTRIQDVYHTFNDLFMRYTLTRTPKHTHTETHIYTDEK